MSTERVKRISAIRSISLIGSFAVSLMARAGPVTNGGFETTPLNSPTSFLMTPGATNEVQDWSTTSGATFLIYPGTATTPISGYSLWPGCGVGSTVFNCIPIPLAQQLPAASPAGGNFISADGGYLQGTLEQTLFNLIPQHSYAVTFWQAAAQLHDASHQCCSGATTELWDVSLGSEHHLSALMNNMSQSFVDWQFQTLTFTATSASEVLGFFAVGTPSGIPPFVLLDGVSIQAVPEPSTFSLLGAAMIAFVFARSRRKRYA